MREHYLPVATHVARREAMKTVMLANGFKDTFASIVAEVLDPIRARFLDRARLSDEGYAEAAASARAAMVRFGPIRFEEQVRNATRARPKGEEIRFRAIVRWGWDKSGSVGRAPFDLFGMTLAISRKRFAMAYTLSGVSYTRHMLERSIERDLAAWAGRFIEVEDALVESCGLMVAWRHACARGLVAVDEFALPLGDGLILGQFRPRDIEKTDVRVDIGGGSSWQPREVAANPALIPPAFGMAGRNLRFECSTAVQGDLLSIPQINLRDGLRTIMQRHAEVLPALGNACFWALDAAAFEALAPGLDAAVADLARLLRRPSVETALRRDEGWIALLNAVVNPSVVAKPPVADIHALMTAAGAPKTVHPLWQVAPAG